MKNFTAIYLKKRHKIPFVYIDWYDNYYIVNMKFSVNSGYYKYSIRLISKIELLSYIGKMNIVYWSFGDYIE